MSKLFIVSYSTIGALLVCAVVGFSGTETGKTINGILGQAALDQGYIAAGPSDDNVANR